MKGQRKVGGKRKEKRPPRGAVGETICPPVHGHAFEVRRKAVQLCLEESFPAQQVAQEMGVGFSTLSKWMRLYRDQGEAGLQAKPRDQRNLHLQFARRRRWGAAPALREQILLLRRRGHARSPSRRSQRIVGVVRRWRRLNTSQTKSWLPPPGLLPLAIHEPGGIDGRGDSR